MRLQFLITLLALAGLACNVWANETKEKHMRLQLQFENHHFVFALKDNAAARDLWNLLPLELQFSDYVGKEKVATLPQKLSAQENEDYHPQVGDFFYFAPWNKVGIYYAKQPPYPGLIKLGVLEGDQESLIQSLQNQKKDFRISISKMPNSH